MVGSRVFLAGALVFAIHSPAVAAELSVKAPAGCDREATLREDAERLIGGPLSGVSGMDFEIEVHESETQGWTLRLVTIERPAGTARVRELTGDSCAEVTNAGAVALALAAQQAPETSAAGEPVPRPAVEAEAPAPEAPATLAPAPQPDRRPPSARTANRESASFVFGGGLLVDSGALPALSPGAELELSLRDAGFRFAATGAIFTTQHAELDDGRGGDFRLLAVGALACWERGRAVVTPTVCAGYEIGSLEGEGTRVEQSRLGSALWQAARVEAGLLASFDSFGIEARAGVALPLERREFLLEGTDLVHRPGGLSGRFYLGLRSSL